MAKVDVTENESLGSRFNVEGFPTISLFHEGQVYKFKGKRTLENIVAFVKGGYKAAVEETVEVPQKKAGEESDVIVLTQDNFEHEVLAAIHLTSPIPS